MTENEARAALQALGIWLPNVGDIWCWEPMKPHATQEVAVTGVVWNGEEWEIETTGIHSGTHWNDWSRFMEACVLVQPVAS